MEESGPEVEDDAGAIGDEQSTEETLETDPAPGECCDTPLPVPGITSCKLPPAPILAIPPPRKTTSAQSDREVSGTS